MTWPLVCCIALAAAAGGFALGWRQCQEQNDLANHLRESGERIRAEADDIKRREEGQLD